MEYPIEKLPRHLGLEVLISPSRKRLAVPVRRIGCKPGGVKWDLSCHRIELGTHLCEILDQGPVRGNAAKWIEEGRSILEVDIVADVIDGKGPHAVVVGQLEELVLGRSDVARAEFGDRAAPDGGVGRPAADGVL